MVLPCAAAVPLTPSPRRKRIPRAAASRWPTTASMTSWCVGSSSSRAQNSSMPSAAHTSRPSCSSCSGRSSVPLSALDASSRSSISRTWAARRAFTELSSRCRVSSRPRVSSDCSVSISCAAMSVTRASMVLKARASRPNSSSPVTFARTRMSPISARAMVAPRCCAGLTRNLREVIATAIPAKVRVSRLPRTAPCLSMEGEDGVGPRHVLGVGDQRTQPHQQDHGGGDCGSEDQLQRDRAADAGEHFLILPSAPRRASRGVRNVADRALESCAPYPPGRGSRPVRRVLTALLLFALPAAAEEIRIELSRGRPAARLDGPGARLSQGGRVLEVPGPLHEVAARGGVLLVDGRKLEGGEPLIVRPGSGRLRVDGRPLPGRLEAWADPGGLVLVNALDLEDYVAAVVASEVPRDWPDAALEAQAVAARTFAVAQKIAQGPAARAHLGSSVLDQVYAGAAHPASGALRAAHATAGEVLTYGAAPIAAYFSASCGGRSETGEDAFNLAGGSTPYLVSEQDDADAGRAWVVRKPLAQISAALRKAGRVLAKVTSVSVSARTLRGESYRQILAHYYPGSEVRRMY